MPQNRNRIIYPSKQQPVLGFRKMMNPEDHQWWSEPKRFKRNPRHVTALQAPAWAGPTFVPFTPEQNVASRYEPFSLPKRFKRGLRADLQHFYEAPSRYLPRPDITATMNSSSHTDDAFLFGLNIYDSSPSTTSGQGAKVSIYETGPGGDPVSIRED